MKRLLFILHSLLLPLAAILILLTSCERRELTYDYHPYCEVLLEADWSQFVETPTGMTAIFYPENGSTTVTHTTNSVHSTTVNLREGRYNVILFNQSPPEFGTIGFRGLERYEKAEFFAQEPTSNKGWYSKADDETVVVEPEPLAVATLEGFEVTPDMIDQQRAQAKVEARSQTRTVTRAAIALTPKNIIAKGNITVHVKGIYNLRSVRGSITGMAGGFFPAAFSTGTERVTHLLEDWLLELDDDDYAEGVIKTGYTTFGIPGMKLGRARAATRADGENLIADVWLNLSILLVDNKTVKDYRFRVGDLIDISEETGEIVLTLILEENPDGGVLIDLPDVKPEGGSAGGFDATVEDWGERKDIEVEL